MQKFDYLAIVVSIIVGLAIAELLQGVAGLIKERQRVRIYWIHLIWVAFLFVLIINASVGFWSWRDFTNWNFHLYLFLLLSPITIYLMTAFMFPNFAADNQIDLKTHYYFIHKWFFGAVAFCTLLGNIEDGINSGRWLDIENFVLLIGFVICIAAAIIKNEKFHIAITVFLILLFFVFQSRTIWR